METKTKTKTRNPLYEKAFKKERHKQNKINKSRPNFHNSQNLGRFEIKMSRA